MADTSKINENNVGSLSDDEIKGLDPNQLEKVLDLLDDIVRSGRELDKEQRRVYESASRYHRELEKANEELDEGIEKTDNLFERFENGVSKLQGGLRSIQNVVEGGFFNPLKSLAGSWGKADQAANDFGKTIGGNAKAVGQLRDETIKFANDTHIGAKYNTDIQGMIKLQESYSKQVGRNLQLTNTQRETLLATSKVMGDKALDFSKKLENLGIGLERSGDIAGKMFAEASKSGISFEKYSASVTENLTKVQSYGFRNGVEGLTSMAKKAAEVNLNISEAFKVADKIQSGGVEAAIKMGANLQVLGGSFAQFGDPMGMLYQGLNDMEGLQDRMIDMFSHMGQIENGQVKISGANRLRVNAAAQAMGISSDEMFNMINRQAVRGEIGKQMGSRFDGDEELKELIMNTATLNKNNQAVVNINGQERRLDEISSDDKKYLQDMQKTQSEDIKDIAQILRGYTDIQEGFTKEIENKKASSFSEIGKFTKMIYGKMSQSNVMLEIIKDAVLAQAIMSSIGSISGGLGRGAKKIFGKKGVGGGKTPTPGTAVPRQAPQTPIKSNYTRTERVSAANELKAKGYTFKDGQIYRPDGSLAKGNVAQGGKVDAGRVLAKETSAGKIAQTASNATNTGTAVAKSGGVLAKTGGFLAKNGFKMLGGGAIGGIMTGIGYLADGSFKGTQAEKNKAIGGTIGSIAVGALGSLLGPIGTMIGTEVGKFAGEWVSKGVDKIRANKKTEFTKELGGKDSDKGKAFENLSDNYNRWQLKKIKDAMKDGKITEGELSDNILKKMAKNGDTGIIEKYGTKSAKAKMNKQIEAINAKIESGRFNMETGSFNIGNADFGAIEPIAMASGGKLEGPSDINGPGMPIQGTNIVVGGGEYVVNRDATAKNERLLDAINAGATFKMANGGIIPTPTVRFENGGVIPVPQVKFEDGGKIPIPVKISNILPSLIKNPMAPLKVAANKAKDFVSDRFGGVDKMEVAPIKLDVSGTIKLDSGGQQVDLNAIINNPAFLTQLSQMIERRLSDNINGGNFKELRKNKRHTF